MADTENGVNVQVLLRCRPVSDREIIDRTPQVVSCDEAAREVTLFQNAGGKQHSRTFRFDKVTEDLGTSGSGRRHACAKSQQTTFSQVFGSDSQQEKLYKQAIIPIVCEVMDGFNCTIFAYGQTGTGAADVLLRGPWAHGTCPGIVHQNRCM